MTRSIQIEESGAAAGERIAGEQLATIQASSVDSATVIAGGGDMFEWFGGGGRAAGINVTPETAMRLAAVWRCVTLIAGAMMSMSLGVYKRTPDGGRELQEDHPYMRFLVDEADDFTSAPEFVELQAMHVMLRGNGYGLLRQARNGVLHDIEYFHPTRVMPYWSGKAIWYRFTNIDGTTEDHHSSYVLHFKGPGRSWDGLRALSTVSHHAQTIGVGLATREYTAGQFERGLMTNDYFQAPAGQKISDEQRKDFKEYLRKKAQGVANAHNPLLLENGIEWKRVSITAKDAQLLELLQYSAVDCARVFGVPPHMIGETDKSTSWGSGIEQLSKGFVLYTILPHARRFASELSRKLFPVVGAKRSEYFIAFDADELMEGDAKSQGEYFRQAIGGNQLPGWMTANEIRRRKRLKALPNGEELYTPTGAAVPGEPLVAPEEEPNDESKAA